MSFCAATTPSKTNDPVAPERIRPEFDSGDHLHPNDAGLKAMGEAVDIGPFR